jgi:hypothetical protein
MADKAKEKSMLGRLLRDSKSDIPVAPLAPPSEPPASSKSSTADSSSGKSPAAENSDWSKLSLSERAEALERELNALRTQSAQALAAAEEQLGKAARRIEEVDEIRRQSMPPPPTELNEAKAKAARTAVEMNELRADRDEQKRRLEAAQADLDSARAQAGALSAALVARDARVGLLESAAHANSEKSRSEAARADESEAKRRGLAEALEQSAQGIS